MKKKIGKTNKAKLKKVIKDLKSEAKKIQKELNKAIKQFKNLDSSMEMPDFSKQLKDMDFKLNTNCNL